MPQREERFYNAYSYGDKLEPGEKMTLEHHISFNPYSGCGYLLCQRPGPGNGVFEDQDRRHPR